MVRKIWVNGQETKEEEEGPAMGMWRVRGERNGERRDRKKERIREQESKRKRVSEEGASISFYSESGTPGYCQVTVGQSLDKMPTEARRCVSELESLKVVTCHGDAGNIVTVLRKSS